jgi:hypothetical protein
MAIYPAQFFLELLRREPRGAQYTHPSGIGHFDDHVSAMRKAKIGVSIPNISVTLVRIKRLRTA